MILIGPGCIPDRKLGQPEFGIETEELLIRVLSTWKGLNYWEAMLCPCPSRRSRKASLQAGRGRQTPEGTGKGVTGVPEKQHGGNESWPAGGEALLDPPRALLPVSDPSDQSELLLFSVTSFFCFSPF